MTGIKITIAILIWLATAVPKPPPAWMDTSTGRHKLGLSSYCWQAKGEGVCADAIAPKCGARGLPTIRVRRGELVRFELAFAPSGVQLTVEGHVEKLKTSGRPTWHADRAGALSLFVDAGTKGDVSYVACIVFR